MNELKSSNVKSYLIGFVFSLLFTVSAYCAVTLHIYPTDILLGVIILLALLQLVVQLVFFLHLDREGKPHWNLMALAFALLVLLIVVGGSLWIMNNLNYHMTQGQINLYMNSQDGL